MHTHACRDCGETFLCDGHVVWLENHQATLVEVCLLYDGPQPRDQCRRCATFDAQVALEAR